MAYAATTSEGVDYSTGPVFYGALTFIMVVLLAALYWAIIHQRGLRFAPPLPCARASVVRTLLPPVGRAHLREHCDNSPRARLTGFYHGVGAPTGPPLGASTLRFAPPQPPKHALGFTSCSGAYYPMVRRSF